MNDSKTSGKEQIMTVEWMGSLKYSELRNHFVEDSTQPLKFKSKHKQSCVLRL